MNVPQHFAHTHDNQHFTVITPHQISKCIGTSVLFYKFGTHIMHYPLTFHHFFYNQKESVQLFCDFRILTNRIRPNIVELSPSYTLIQNPMVALDCPSGQRIIK